MSARGSRAAIEARLAALEPRAASRAALLDVEPAASLFSQHYVDAAAPTYVDSVVGMRHTLDLGLPGRAIDWVRAVVNGDEAGSGAALLAAYREPIAALHDEDLVLPNTIELAYYAVYNLTRGIEAGPRGVQWLAIAIDQAIAARKAAS